MCLCVSELRRRHRGLGKAQFSGQQIAQLYCTVFPVASLQVCSVEIGITGHIVEGGKMADKRLVVTRRSLLHTGWRAAALVGVAGACPDLAVWKRNNVGLRELTAESFRRFEGSDLRFSRPVARGGILSRTVALKLTEVITHDKTTQIEARNPEIYQKRSREPFSLVFELKGDKPLEEGLHRLIHKDIAACDLFLSRISQPRSDGAIFYEAVFG
jgi:hypothetical protein